MSLLNSLNTPILKNFAALTSNLENLYSFLTIIIYSKSIQKNESGK